MYRPPLNRLAVVAIVPPLLMFATACATLSSAASWKKGQNAGVSPARQTGAYELIAGRDQVQARYDVQAGEPIGFQTNAQGRVEAVAGVFTVPLNSTKSYRWVYAKQQQQQ